MIRLRAGNPRTFGATTVIPIERVGTSLKTGPGGAWLRATREPVAVVLWDHEGCRAVDVDARSRRIEEFLSMIPELAPLMAQSRSQRRRHAPET